MMPRSILYILITICLVCLAQTGHAQEQPSDSTGLSFVVLGHSYPLWFGGSEQDIERVLQAIADCEPDVLILTGDVLGGSGVWMAWPTHWNRDDAVHTSIQRQWEHVEAILNRLGIPVWFVPGGHDTSSRLPDQQRIIEAMFQERHGPLYYSKTLNGYSFIALNSTPYLTRKPYTLDEVQLEWLDQTLAANPEVPKILLLHHPLWYSDLNIHPGNAIMGQTPWMETVHPKLRQSNVLAAFAGDGGGGAGAGGINKGSMFYENRDGLLYYLSGIGLNTGATFLHVQARGKVLDVHPYYLDMDFSYIGNRPALLRRLEAEALVPAFGWGFLCACVICGLIFIFFRRRKARH
jgi:3',5'-cyclic AMP phosphodiesterase CpdA